MVGKEDPGGFGKRALDSLMEVMYTAPVLTDDEWNRTSYGEYDTPLVKTAVGTAAMTLAGFCMGDIKCRWDYQMPNKNKELYHQMLKLYQRKWAVTMGFVGGTYVLTDALIEKYRKKRDFLNSVYAGWAAGAAYGLKVGSFKWAFGAAFMISTVTMLSDLAENSTRRKTNKEFYPFPTE